MSSRGKSSPLIRGCGLKVRHSNYNLNVSLIPVMNRSRIKFQLECRDDVVSVQNRTQFVAAWTCEHLRTLTVTITLTVVPPIFLSPLQETRCWCLRLDRTGVGISDHWNDRTLNQRYCTSSHTVTAYYQGHNSGAQFYTTKFKLIVHSPQHLLLILFLTSIDPHHDACCTSTPNLAWGLRAHTMFGIDYR